MEYQINVQIARSNCKKPLNNTVNCATQKNSKLEKVSDKWAIYDNASDFKSCLGLARLPGSWIILGAQTIIIGGLDDSPWGIPYGPSCCPQE